MVQRGAIVADTASAHAVHVEVGDHAPDRSYDYDDPDWTAYAAGIWS